MMRQLRDLLMQVPLDDEDTAIEEIAQRLVNEGMGTAAILFFETSKPISFLGGQAALIATPLLGGFIEPARLERYSDLMSNRAFIERLIRRIEDLEAERTGTGKRRAE